MTTSGLPFDDIRNLVRQLPEMDSAAAERTHGFFAPVGWAEGLGRLEDLAAWFSGAAGRSPARVGNPVIALFAATHGVSRRLGSDDPVAAARDRVEEIAAGAAPVSQLCASGNFGLNVFDLALEVPVGDITEVAALDERGCAATIAFGMEAVATGADLIGLGGADTAADAGAMALISALTGRQADAWEQIKPQERSVIADALNAHDGHLNDPLEALRRLGGREIAALVGAILAARTQKVAVILGGLASTAAAVVLNAMTPRAVEHCLLAAAVDPVHREVAEEMGLVPLLDLGEVRQDGVAAALAANMVKSAVDVAAGVAEVRSRQQR
ncbi:nicotinate-nucleotide--dimethylbenzimidazole phosphoribosyltransferase [Chelativorans sp. YIM 93263]|uniref:nicotinate-nucleotide--dimethylbenzimidazole phosphoribosyltransferase n=1 Tax=Chelativorans sp. YIM 93263 TaxID=2906648 RepID=UPI002378966A|nr:nicotinate-nucleotide--dimethylbenzimidazole phosphoribosyltransferase [Chelativorans sp. YIM 93263]